MKRKLLNKNNIEIESLYLRTHLRQLLKSENLPYTKTTVLRLEKEGVIPESDFKITSPNIINKPWLVFKGSTLLKAVERMREHYK